MQWTQDPDHFRLTSGLWVIEVQYSYLGTHCRVLKDGEIVRFTSSVESAKAYCNAHQA